MIITSTAYRGLQKSNINNNSSQQLYSNYINYNKYSIIIRETMMYALYN